MAGCGGESQSGRRSWHHRKLPTAHQHLGRQQTGIVARSHHRAIGTGGLHRQQIVRLQLRQHAILGQIIAAFADRSDDIGGMRRFWGTGALHHDIMMGLVEGRPDQIVHRRIDDDETPGRALLHIDHAGQQHAGIADQQSAGLADHLGAQRHNLFTHDGGIARQIDNMVAAIIA